MELLPLEGSIQPGGKDRLACTSPWTRVARLLGECRRLRGATEHQMDPPGRHYRRAPHAVSRAPQVAARPAHGFRVRGRSAFPHNPQRRLLFKAPSTAHLCAHVNWLVCREVCIPGKADLALPLQVTAQKGTADPGRQALSIASAVVCHNRFRPPPRPSSGRLPAALRLPLPATQPQRRVFSPGSNTNPECRASTCPASGRRRGDRSKEGRELPYAAGATERGVSVGGWNSL